MLLRKGLCRCHQRTLAARLDRSQQRVERDNGLAGADVSLQQSLHRHRALEIVIDLRDGAFLVLGEPERQDLPVPHQQLAGLAERGCDLAFTLAPPPRDSELEEQQLVEGEPAPARFGLAERARPVQGPESVGTLRQSLTLLQLSRQWIGERTWQGRADELAQLLRRDLFAGGVDRREVCGGLAVTDVEAPDVEAITALPAA